MTEEWYNIVKRTDISAASIPKNNTDPALQQQGMMRADKFGNKRFVSPHQLKQEEEERKRAYQEGVTRANAREVASQQYKEEQAKIPYTGGARPMPTAPGKFTDRAAWRKQMGARKVSDRSTTSQTMPKTSHPTKQRVAAGFKAIGDTRAAEAKEAARPMTQGDMANAKTEINQQIQALQAELRNLQNAQPEQQ